MVSLPRASVTVDDSAPALAGGTELCCVLAPVATQADAVPRQYGSAADVYAVHGYSEGLEYVAHHIDLTGRPVLFVGLPIATAGTIGRENTSGRTTGTSVTTVAAGGSGVLSEHDGVLTVVTGGTIGLDQIVLDLSLDGGRTTRRVRLGTANSYSIPYVGVTVSFAAGTCVAGEVIHTWHGSGPRSDSTGWLAAFTALADQTKLFRSGILIGDLSTDTEASALLARVDAYKTSVDRATFFRASVRDRLPMAEVSSTTHRMTGSPTVVFAEVGATGDTLARGAGSFTADGFATGDIVTVSGTASNNITTAQKITLTSATVITLGTDDLVAETVACTITGQASLTFVDGGGSSDTLVRAGGSPGSWLDDGFRAGDIVTISGTAANNGSFAITALSALTLTVATGSFASEVIGITVPTITAGETHVEHVAASDTEFAPVDDAPRISLALGRARRTSPWSGWFDRRPAAWVDSIRSFQHDLHVAPWQKDLGPTGWSLLDEDNNTVEYDDRAQGGAATAARFGCLRSWANGPSGCFVSTSLTRAEDSSQLLLTNNQAVCDLAVNTCQLATENAVGRNLVLTPGTGKASVSALRTIETEVNEALRLAIAPQSEGPRATSAVWTASRDDVLNVPGAVLHGTLRLNLNATIFEISTTVKVS
ncbi:MAG: hypothetical protein A2Y78_00215 [Acidobacteria bacterium RBG_13_68_16]|nr:MAG: hypothetical protein A2Y78_00215 [Acidobacteria bacterium RBG_13_68_16]